jgi:predicted nucleic acid-binding protein
VRSQAEDVFRRLGKDKKLSSCDALSFVVVTTLLDGMPCLSFDRDLKRLGLTVLN